MKEQHLDFLFGAHCILALTDVDADTCMNAIEYLKRGFQNMPETLIEAQKESLRQLIMEAERNAMEELN